MKRLHIHLSVEELSASVNFYSKIFDQDPTTLKDDYAKWMLEDPRMNFAISTRSGKVALDHFGLQVESEEELTEIRERLSDKNIELEDEGETTCCYMQSDKSWILDPDKFPWEIYRSMKEAQYFNDSKEKNTNACCAPTVKIGKGCS